MLVWPGKGGRTGDSVCKPSLALATLVWSLVAVAGGAEGFTSRATVVLLTGLPGDVESERTYEDQLQRVLRVLALPEARPDRVFVLADSPDRVRLPDGLAGEVRTGSRAAFLALARDVAARPGPLVVMLWGHGGPQGSKAVFHVRGPRLDAADLAAFAAAAGDRPSRWALYFPGSGVFAQALRGPGRELLSSEHLVTFRSDPVGMELLLEAWRANAGLGFPALAESVGRATGAWYDTQRLARTEEPTLWTAAGPAQLLALAQAAPGPAPAAAASAARARGPEWEGLAAVSAAAFPGADAVVLRRVHRFTLGESPAVVHEVDEFVQVLTEEGESRGDLDVAFWPPDERLAFLDCEVLRPDGTLLRHEVSAAPEAPDASASEYPAAQRRAFSLPGVAPGAILRVHYRSEWRRFPLPHVFLEVPLADELPIVDLGVEVRVGSATPLHFAARGLSTPEPDSHESSYGRTYSWHIGAVPALAREVLGPPDPMPRLLLSTFPDWASFSGWYERLVKLADQVTPEIEAQAAQLVRGRASEREKVIALYDFVTSLRYVAVPLGVNSHRPHAAANVLRNHYGDCKDKANLFNTLLKTQGIAAHLVLVPRFGEAKEAVPGLGFNHAISRVKVDGEWLWADTTDEFARFGLLPPGDPGRKVLVVDGQPTGLLALPEPQASDHRLILRGTLAADPDAATSLELEAHGFADYALRQGARQAAGQGTTRPVIAEVFRPVAGTFALRSQTHASLSALDRAFTWRGEGSFSGLVSQAAPGSRLVRAPFWLPREWEAALHDRHTPLYLNQGYPLQLEERLEIVLPAAGNVRLPALQASQEAPLRYRLEWSQPRPDRVLAALQLELASGELSEAESRSFQSQLRSLSAALAQGGVVELASR